MNVGKPRDLACCIADGICGRKLELEHFLSQHGVIICLLSELLLRPGQVLHLANCVCHHTERITAGSGIAVLARWVTVDDAVTVVVLTHLVATCYVGWPTGENLGGLTLTIGPLIELELYAFFLHLVSALTCRQLLYMLCWLAEQ